MRGWFHLEDFPSRRMRLSLDESADQIVLSSRSPSYGSLLGIFFSMIGRSTQWEEGGGGGMRGGEEG